MFENKIMELLPEGIKVERGTDSDFEKSFKIIINDNQTKFFDLTFKRTKKSEWFYETGDKKIKGSNLVRLCVKIIILKLLGE